MALSVMASKASKAVKASSVIAAVLLAAAAAAQPAQGGLYIAGDGFSFETAAQRGLAQNPGGRRFFLLGRTLARRLRLLGYRYGVTQRQRVLA